MIRERAMSGSGASLRIGDSTHVAGVLSIEEYDLKSISSRAFLSRLRLIWFMMESRTSRGNGSAMCKQDASTSLRKKKATLRHRNRVS